MAVSIIDPRAVKVGLRELVMVGKDADCQVHKIVLLLF